MGQRRFKRRIMQDIIVKLVLKDIIENYASFNEKQLTIIREKVVQTFIASYNKKWNSAHRTKARFIDIFSDDDKNKITLQSTPTSSNKFLDI